MDGDDSKEGVTVMSRQAASIRDLIRDPTGRPASPPSPEPAKPVTPDVLVIGDDAQTPHKKSDPLPRPGDPYKAHAGFLNRLSVDTRLIHFVRPDFSCEGYAYSDLRRVSWRPSGKPGSGWVLVLRFVEAVITEVTITGRRLENLHHWISEGGMPWVWQQPANFMTRDDAMTVITGIDIAESER